MGLTTYTAQAGRELTMWPTQVSKSKIFRPLLQSAGITGSGITECWDHYAWFMNFVKYKTATKIQNQA